MATSVDLTTFWEEIASLLDPEEPESDLLPDDWEGWLRSMFPRAVSKPFGHHHRAFWDWAWSIRSVRPRPFIGIWPRGGGKSTAGELAVAALGARGVRHYVVYVSSTQDQADKRVGNISALLESESIAAYYPAAGRRAVGKFGTPRGWRRNRLQSASGFVVDALGLETASRGLKVEDQRPDMIVLDDIDERHDTEAKIRKKLATITETILPMGSGNVAVLGLQNLIIPNGIFAQLASGAATFLVDREVSGPIPAIQDLKTVAVEPGQDIPENVQDSSPIALERFEHLGGESNVVRNIITHGEATWPGQDLEDCQALINTSGLSAFLREQQHEVHIVEGALWKPEMIRRAGRSPTLRRIVVGVDPSGGKAEIGIIAAGLGHDGLAYVLADNTQPGRLGPHNWGTAAVHLWERLEADRIVAEKNFGGDMVESTIRVAAGGRVPVYLVSASRGKVVRAEPVVAFYEEGRVRHVGVFPELETEMTRWVPGDESPNRLDALVWALTELLMPGPRTFSGAAARLPGL